MRKRTAMLWCAALILAVSVSTAARGEEVSRPSRGRASVLRGVRFSVSGEYSGTLDGTILLGDDSYQLGPNVRVYEIGTGPLPVGTVVANRWVYLSGVRRGETGLIQTVIVRPATDLYPDRSDSESHVHEVDHERPS